MKAINALGRPMPSPEEEIQSESSYSNEGVVEFRNSHSDYGHIIVSYFHYDGSKEIIGHVYLEIDGDEIKYVCTSRKGREIFPPTTDFNAVERRYERYARLLSTLETSRQNLIRTNNYKPIKKSNQMKTQNKNSEQKQKKENQFRFIEYEKPTKDGHFVTAADSYHNVIGRIHRSYNEETKKYEYTAFDHAGNLMIKSDKLWEVKKEFTNNREQLLEQAHQRRIEYKQKSGQEKEQSKPASKEIESKKEKEQIPQGKSNEKQPIKNDRQEEREQELEDLRDSQDDRGDIEMER